ncbi:hypothetical protein ACFE04_003365 [Oxalis oulophora]
MHFPTELMLTVGVNAVYLSSADFAMREELSHKAAILDEKFAPDLSWYVDVILQLIDKAGEFVTDDIWFRVVQFITNNEDLQSYAAAKAREYLDKPAIHETMVKLYSTVPILLSTYAKILMHTQHANLELQNQIWAIFNKYESCIDVEIQQRAVEYFALSRKGAALADILAEMLKFPEREFAMLKKTEESKADTAEQSAIKLRAQQQISEGATFIIKCLLVTTFF